MMWPFTKAPTAEVVVDSDGLAQLVRDLHNNGGLHMLASGPTITVFAQTSGNFLVRLDAYHTSILRKAVKRYEFSDVYGPRSDGAGSGGSTDGSG